MDGRIWVDSEENRGTTVSFTVIVRSPSEALSSVLSYQPVLER